MKVVDNSNIVSIKYFPLVLFRKREIENTISRLKWVGLTLVELLVGTELIEQIIVTGSVVPPDNIRKEDSDKFGCELHLNDMIPSGLVTNFLRKHLIQVLYYKYYEQYLLLLPVGKPEINEKTQTIDCWRTRFRARKEVFYQLIAFRRVYEFLWVLFNLLIDLLVYYLSNTIQWALVSALIIEAIKRFLKI